MYCNLNATLVFEPEFNPSLRYVGAYNQLVEERFERCLDLYLCVRYKRFKLKIDSSILLPKFPNPQTLKPFPEFEAIRFKGHTAKVKSISVYSNGQWLVSASDDKTVRIWEVSSGREFRCFKFSSPVKFVEINPCYPLVSILIQTKIIIFLESLFDGFANLSLLQFSDHSNKKKNSCFWERIRIFNVLPKHGGPNINKALSIKTKNDLDRLAWHPRGDFFATVSCLTQKTSLLIHKLSLNISQQPFNRHLGEIQDVSFHPLRPFLIIATKQWLRIYNLSKQTLLKKMKTTTANISSFDIHPDGDNILIGCYDSHVFWFDTNQTKKAFQNLHYHKKAVRIVRFHQKRPLCATAGDDGFIHIFHSKVSQDFYTEPILIPVKILRNNDIRVLDCMFHPTEPWIFSSGTNNEIKLWM